MRDEMSPLFDTAVHADLVQYERHYSMQSKGTRLSRFLNDSRGHREKPSIDFDVLGPAPGGAGQWSLFVQGTGLKSKKQSEPSQAFVLDLAPHNSTPCTIPMACG